jgi:hypothetical protein
MDLGIRPETITKVELHHNVRDCIGFFKPARKHFLTGKILSEGGYYNAYGDRITILETHEVREKEGKIYGALHHKIVIYGVQKLPLYLHFSSLHNAKNAFEILTSRAGLDVISSEFFYKY